MAVVATTPPSLPRTRVLTHTHTLQALRRLVELSPGDDERLELLGEAAGLLSAAPPGAYPPQVGCTGLPACAPARSWLAGCTAIQQYALPLATSASSNSSGTACGSALRLACGMRAI